MQKKLIGKESFPLRRWTMNYIMWQENFLERSNFSSWLPSFFLLHKYIIFHSSHTVAVPFICVHNKSIIIIIIIFVEKLPIWGKKIQYFPVVLSIKNIYTTFFLPPPNPLSPTFILYFLGVGGHSCRWGNKWPGCAFADTGTKSPRCVSKVHFFLFCFLE